MINNTATESSDRIFYISDYINPETMGTMSFELLKILQYDNEKDSTTKNYKRKPIKIFINSYGGHVYDCFGFIDIILHSKTPIYTFVTGKAMSAGFLIFLAGHKRFATPCSTLMCHDVACGTWGKVESLKNNLEETLYLQELIIKFIVRRSKIPEKTLRNNNEKQKDWYIHSDDFEKLGICEIIPFDKDILTIGDEEK